ncbi:hypothetical protein EJB05_25249 [Eragrostis curvula]|uniref:Calmodulin-binding domain-containing protein n=1 Tax=Eragrostis curvula TaxID=38414 RepID=A0A5J9VAZ0_9POAL|nr:hypothetical protein EJB05_25249 [Eragrostis curvula]
MQAQPPDPDIYLWNMKVNKLEAMATPLRSLLRSASARADALSPFSSNPAHQPVSTPATPAASAAAASSFGCMTATPTDTPPATPKDGSKANKAAAPAPATMSSFASLWSPRRLMQRAARAFRISSSSRSRRRMKGDEPGLPVPGRASDAASGGSMDAEHGSRDGGNNGGAAADKVQQEEEDPQQQQQHVEEAVPVPEKIIHVAHHQKPEPVVNSDACENAADEKENSAATAAAEEKEKEEEEPTKKGAVPEPEAVADADMADKFVVVVKEAMKKHEEEADTKEEAMAKFRGSRVKTAMEARGESEQPRRREVARSNEVIEEACTKFLAKRQGSRVRALVGAFETVMDAKPVAAGKPKHHYRQSA